MRKEGRVKLHYCWKTHCLLTMIHVSKNGISNKNRRVRFGDPGWGEAFLEEKKSDLKNIFVKLLFK